MFNKVHVVRKLNAQNDSVVGKVANLVHNALFLDSKKHIVSEDLVDDKTLVVAIGGDGTMLGAMRLAHTKNAVATGINLGNVGFLTDFSNDADLFTHIANALHDRDQYIEERIALQYNLLSKDELNPFNHRLAFNEFVISNKYSDHLIKYTLFIADRRAGSHRANALITSTPTGSTAYALSAGGGLLLPSMQAFQVIPVAPINLTSRPIIIPSHEEIRISIETEGEWILKGDGVTIGTFDNNSFIDTQIVITQSPQKVKILHSKHWSYFDMLTQKLGWKNT